MRAFLFLLAFAFVAGAAPAAAMKLEHQTPHNAKPKAVAAFHLAAKRVEMVAVTKRARADTPLRRAQLDESEDMAKFLPGYPQPAFVSVDIRIKF